MESLAAIVRNLGSKVSLTVLTLKVENDCEVDLDGDKCQLNDDKSCALLVFKASEGMQYINIQI